MSTKRENIERILREQLRREFSQKTIDLLAAATDDPVPDIKP